MGLSGEDPEVRRPARRGAGTGYGWPTGSATTLFITGPWLSAAIRPG